MDQYAFYSFVRHPMERFLAGFHQIEIFWRMNWIAGKIDKLGLLWWNTSCILSSEYEELDSHHPCTGSEPKSDVITRLGRLNSFLDDIESVGYFDQHIIPITYQLSVSPLITELSEKAQPQFFDIESMDDVSDTLATVTGYTMQKKDEYRKMVRTKDQDDKMTWIIFWSELTELATSGQGLKNAINREAKSAQNAIEKMCYLYENDVKCLPYDIPECKNIGIRSQ
uniref:Sulfotransferase family protein n=1 Tax=Eucampia antarctica TaxID=49252 RepID=A0A7S2WEI2_9STRA